MNTVTFRRILFCSLLLISIFALLPSSLPQQVTQEVGNPGPKLPVINFGNIATAGFYTSLSQWLQYIVHNGSHQLYGYVGSFTSEVVSELQLKPFIGPVYASSNYGVTSTGATYPAAETKLYSSQTYNSASLSVFANNFTTTVPEAITKLETDWQTAGSTSSHFIMGVYNSSSGQPGTLLGSVEGSVSATGWLVLTLGTPIYLTAVTTYWLAMENQSASNKFYYQAGAANSQCSITHTYDGTLPSTYPACSLDNSAINTGYFAAIEGFTIGTRVQYTDTTSSNGAVSSFSFYTHTGAAGDHFILEFYSDLGSGATDSTGSTVAHGDNHGLLVGTSITASASGVLTSLGANFNTAAGYARLAIYSTFSSNKFSGLLAESASTAVSTGWNDFSVINVTISSGVTYWIAVQYNTSCQLYSTGVGGQQYYVSYTYGAFPSTTATLASSAYTENVRMTYSPSPYQRLWYSASTGSASTTWNVVNYASGTTDNSWAGALTHNAYYWFIWQWDTTVLGPSYAAGSAGTGIYKAAAYGTLDSTWSGGASSANNWSMYLTYSLNIALTRELSETMTAAASSPYRTAVNTRTNTGTLNFGQTITSSSITTNTVTNTTTSTVTQLTQTLVSPGLHNLSFWNDLVYAGQFQASGSGTLISLGTDVYSGTSSDHIRMKFYADSSNNPSSLLAETNSTNASTDWNDITPTSTPSLVATTYYWVGFETDSASIVMWYNGIGGCSVIHAYGTGPNPFGICNIGVLLPTLRITYGATTTTTNTITTTTMITSYSTFSSLANVTRQVSQERIPLNYYCPQGWTETGAICGPAPTVSGGGEFPNNDDSVTTKKMEMYRVSNVSGQPQVFDACIPSDAILYFGFADNVTPQHNTLVQLGPVSATSGCHEYVISSMSIVQGAIPIFTPGSTMWIVFSRSVQIDPYQAIIATGTGCHHEHNLATGYNEVWPTPQVNMGCNITDDVDAVWFGTTTNGGILSGTRSRLVAGANRVISNSIVNADNLFRYVVGTRFDSASLIITLTLNRSYVTIQRIVSPVFTLTGNIVSTLTGSRYSIGSIINTDNLARIANGERIINGAVTITSGMMRSFANLNSTLTNVLTYAVIGLYRVVSNNRYNSGPIVLTPSPDRNVVLQRIGDITLILTTDIKRGTSNLSSSLSNVITGAVTVVRIVSLQRTNSGSFNINATVLIITTVIVSTVRSLTDSIVVAAGNLDRLMNVQRPSTGEIINNVSLARFVSNIRFNTASLVVTDFTYRIVNSIRVAVENITINLNASRGFAELSSTLNVAVNIVTSPFRVVSGTRVNNESITLVTVSDRVVNLIRNAIGDIINTGNISRGFSYLSSTVNQTINIVVSPLRTLIETRINSESTLLGSSNNRIVNNIRTALDNLTIFTLNFASLTYERVTQEPITLTGNTYRLVSNVRTLIESNTMVSDVIHGAIFITTVKVVSAALSVVDNVSRGITTARFTLQSLVINGNINRVVSVTRNLVEYFKYESDIIRQVVTARVSNAFLSLSYLFTGIVVSSPGGNSTITISTTSVVLVGGLGGGGGNYGLYMALIAAIVLSSVAILMYFFKERKGKEAYD